MVTWNSSQIQETPATPVSFYNKFLRLKQFCPCLTISNVILETIQQASELLNQGIFSSFAIIGNHALIEGSVCLPMLKIYQGSGHIFPRKTRRNEVIRLAQKPQNTINSSNNKKNN